MFLCALPSQIRRNEHYLLIFPSSFLTLCEAKSSYNLSFRFSHYASWRSAQPHPAKWTFLPTVFPHALMFSWCGDPFYLFVEDFPNVLFIFIMFNYHFDYFYSFCYGDHRNEHSLWIFSCFLMLCPASPTQRPSFFLFFNWVLSHSAGFTNLL